MTDTNNTDGAALLPVTQADRDAAADAVKSYRDQKNGNWQQRIRDGLCDDGEMVQSFTRHRLSHSIPAHVIAALEPFACDDFETPITDEQGWTEFGLSWSKDRIRDWFGPSAFRRAREMYRAALTPSPCPGDGMREEAAEARRVEAIALNQNDEMRQQLSHVGNMISDLARAMGVDQADADGGWPDLAGRIQKLIDAALTPSALSPGWTDKGREWLADGAPMSEPVQKLHELPRSNFTLHRATPAGHRPCRHCEQKDPHCSVCEGVGYLPSAVSGDAGEVERLRGVLERIAEGVSMPALTAAEGLAGGEY